MAHVSGLKNGNDRVVPAQTQGDNQWTAAAKTTTRRRRRGGEALSALSALSCRRRHHRHRLSLSLSLSLSLFSFSPGRCGAPTSNIIEFLLLLQLAVQGRG
jgi:hypothetical protein